MGRQYVYGEYIFMNILGLAESLKKRVRTENSVSEHCASFGTNKIISANIPNGETICLGILKLKGSQVKVS